MRQDDDILRRLLGYRLQRTNHTVMIRLKDVLSAHGLRRTTFSCLCLIVDRPGIRQSDLSGVLAIDRPNLVQIIDELQRLGLVERKVDPSDRRVNTLHPTRGGVDLCAEAFEQVMAFDRSLTANMTPDERELMVRLLSRMEQAAEITEDTDADRIPTA